MFAYRFGLIILSIFFGAAGPSLAGPKSCPHFDYRSHFGPIRDQDGHGYCWAFATAALMEEHFCLSNKSYCGKSVSPIDVTSLTPPIEGDMGDSQGSLENALSFGVCLEKFAPFKRISTSEDCTMADFVEKEARAGTPFAGWIRSKAKYKGMEDCTDLKLTEKFNGLLKASRGCIRCALESNDIKAQVQLTALEVQQSLPDSPISKDEIIAAIENAHDKGGFIRRISSPEACRENRKKFSKQGPKAQGDYLNGSVEEKASRIIQVFKSGRSVALGICQKQNSIGNYEFDEATPDCHGHDLVINAMKWDKEHSVCRVNLRNSWGKGNLFDGWVDLETVMRSAKYMDYIGETK